MNTDPKKSAQPCGCDEGANHFCKQHDHVLVETETSGTIRIDRTPEWARIEDGPCDEGEDQDDPHVGIGGAPTRCTTLPVWPTERKEYPIATGFMDYFPDAIAAVAHLSYRGNQQHNPGQPLHWARFKSADEADTMMRHFLRRGTLDTDGVRHSAKMVWRALAYLQKEIEGEDR